ncbi:MAG: response regulator [Nitrospirae bacterium]|nr:response regulator [Nitrospirota bacterium]
MEKKRVLIIDDEEIVRRSCKRVLETEGYDVVLASSGENALLEMEKDAFDLVITDLIMPDMDGFELIQSIKTRWPKHRIVVMTGYGTHDANERSLELGASGFLKKPFLPDDLISVANSAKIPGDKYSYFDKFD